MEPLSLFLGLVLALIVGCIVLCFRMFSKQQEAEKEIRQLKEVLQAFISIQERNIAELRAELQVPSGHPGKSVPSPAPDRSMERKERSEDLTGQGALLYTESQEKAQRRRYVWELADQGLSVEEIARRTQLPLGQIDVILNMRGISQEGSKLSWP
jgi:hypothetical protein